MARNKPDTKTFNNADDDYVIRKTKNKKKIKTAFVSTTCKDQVHAKAFAK